MAASHRAHHTILATSRADWLKFLVYLALIHTLLLSAVAGRVMTAAIFAGLCVTGARELRAHRDALPRVLRAAPLLPALLLAIGLAHSLLGPERAWFNSFALLVLLVASTDAFAQLCGQLCGRHRPFPRLSPRKTAEGLLGGWIAALLVSVLCGFLAPELPAVRRACLGIATALAATGGDLLFSALKRRAHIKDFSSFLPGHGGILDRFDSMVLAAPVYYWTRVLVAG
jgi:phosphatidate cytidylyltransferase